jgi:hypothetical protein
MRLHRFAQSAMLTGLLLGLLVLSGCGFVGTTYISRWNPPGVLWGLWHGLLAPWAVILGIVLDIKMYAVPNTGWWYDAAFLIGVVLSLPIGWIAAIIALGWHFYLHSGLY